MTQTETVHRTPVSSVDELEWLGHVDPDLNGHTPISGDGRFVLAADHFVNQVVRIDTRDGTAAVLPGLDDATIQRALAISRSGRFSVVWSYGSPVWTNGPHIAMFDHELGSWTLIATGGGCDYQVPIWGKVSVTGDRLLLQCGDPADGSSAPDSVAVVLAPGGGSRWSELARWDTDFGNRVLGMSPDGSRVGGYRPALVAADCDRGGQGGFNRSSQHQPEVGTLEVRRGSQLVSSSRGSCGAGC